MSLCVANVLLNPKNPQDVYSPSYSLSSLALEMGLHSNTPCGPLQQFPLASQSISRRVPNGQAGLSSWHVTLEQSYCVGLNVPIPLLFPASSRLSVIILSSVWDIVFLIISQNIFLMELLLQKYLFFCFLCLVTRLLAHIRRWCFGRWKRKQWFPKHGLQCQKFIPCNIVAFVLTWGFLHTTRTKRSHSKKKCGKFTPFVASKATNQKPKKIVLGIRRVRFDQITLLVSKKEQGIHFE